jgi:hypothetical protein
MRYWSLPSGMPFVHRYPPASIVGMPNANTSLKPFQNVSVSATVTLGPGVLDIVPASVKLKLAIVRLIWGCALTTADVMIP